VAAAGHADVSAGAGGSWKQSGWKRSSGGGPLSGGLHQRGTCGVGGHGCAAGARPVYCQQVWNRPVHWRHPADVTHGEPALLRKPCRSSLMTGCSRRCRHCRRDCRVSAHALHFCTTLKSRMQEPAAPHPRLGADRRRCPGGARRHAASRGRRSCGGRRAALRRPQARAALWCCARLALCLLCTAEIVVQLPGISTAATHGQVLPLWVQACGVLRHTLLCQHALPAYTPQSMKEA
jgi:hypothetical protein